MILFFKLEAKVKETLNKIRICHFYKGQALGVEIWSLESIKKEIMFL